MIEAPVTISINGKVLPTFESLNLTQKINEHHQFEVILDQEAIEEFRAYTIEKSKEWLGKSIVIGLDEAEFLGIITNVRMSHNCGFYGQIIVTGYSKTILLEGGKHMQSWLKKDLSKIVKEIAESAGVRASVAPKFTTPFEYQAQYRETHFQFLQRLAKQHSEWLFYDGENLIFGKPSLSSPIDLEYGPDIQHLDISINAIPSKQSVFSYNPLDDKQHEDTSKDIVAGLSELGEFAFNVSKELYSITPKISPSARVKDKGEIDAFIEGNQSSMISESNVLTATSTKQGLQVGSVVNVSAEIEKDGQVESKNYGEYIITSIVHQATGFKEYTNRFEAVSSGVNYLTNPNVEMPIAESQIATVISNEDPEKKGRIEVQFQWQSGDMKTAWIRVMTPDAGSSEKVGVNRGFVFIPEVGDQVMVGFRYNDPNRPFVMGSLFNGTTGAGGDQENKSKSITTRSGSTIVFDDDANDGNITIVDAAQNSISLDGKGVVSITANDQISLHVGKSALVMDKDGNIMLTGEKIFVKGEQEIGLVASKGEAEGSAVALIPDEATVSGKDNLVLAGKKSASLASDETTVSGKTKVDVAGGKVNLN